MIDFEEFLHVMNEKRGGDSSFGAIVHKVEKRLNPLLEGDTVTFMHKGSKVTGALVKKQGPFWTVDLGEGLGVASIPSSSLSRAVATVVRFSTSSATSPSPMPAPAVSPISQKSSPSVSKKKPSASVMSKLSISSLFKQASEPDPPLSAMSTVSEVSQKSLPVAPIFSPAESKVVPSRAESKAMSKKVSERKSQGRHSDAQSESKFVKPSLGKLDSTEEKSLFGEMKTTSSVAKKPTMKSEAKKQPMGSFVSEERPKGAFESREKSPLKTQNAESTVAKEEEVEAQGIFDASQVSSFRELFRFYDKGGTIKKTELLKILSQMDIDLPSNILTAIIEKVDRGDGRISFDAFLSGLTRAKATKEYYTESEREEDSPVRTAKKSPMLSDTLRGGSSDEEEEAKFQEHRRTWFTKANMTPVVQVWQGSPRSPSSPDQLSPTMNTVNTVNTTPNTTTTTMSTHYASRSSGIVTGSSANLGTANIDNVLASLFPRAKIQHSSNGTVMITPNGTSVIESPQSRLEEIIGRFGVSSDLSRLNEPLPRKQPPAYTEARPPSSVAAPVSEEEYRREKALRGRNLIGGILTNQQSEKKVVKLLKNIYFSTLSFSHTFSTYRRKLEPGIATLTCPPSALRLKPQSSRGPPPWLLPGTPPSPTSPPLRDPHRLSPHTAGRKVVR